MAMASAVMQRYASAVESNEFSIFVFWRGLW
jgi:hypothetical protein